MLVQTRKKKEDAYFYLILRCLLVCPFAFAFCIAEATMPFYMKKWYYQRKKIMDLTVCPFIHFGSHHVHSSWVRKDTHSHAHTHTPHKAFYKKLRMYVCWLFSNHISHLCLFFFCTSFNYLGLIPTHWDNVQPCS